MEWLIGDWHQLLPTPWANIALCLVATACGIVVGAEREKKEKAAGLRTMTLVSLGAAIFTMISVAVAGSQGDPGRIAAQIVTGIGFLGAGSILRGPLGVTGVTTAATIWAMAATGMAVGSGYGGAGLPIAVFIVLVLTAAGAVERRYIGACTMVSAVVEFKPAGGRATVKIEDILDNYHVGPEARTSESLGEDLSQLTFTYCRAHRHHREFLTQIANMPEVCGIHQ